MHGSHSHESSHPEASALSRGALNTPKTRPCPSPCDLTPSDQGKLGDSGSYTELLKDVGRSRVKPWSRKYGAAWVLQKARFWWEPTSWESSLVPLRSSSAFQLGEKRASSSSSLIT